MKFAASAIVLFALLASCNGFIRDQTVVRDECSTGCKSKLKLLMSAVGVGSSIRKAKHACAKSCLEGTKVADRQRMCAKPCGMVLPARSRSLNPSTKVVKICHLCNGNVGAAAQQCRHAIDGLVRRCRKQCRRSTPFSIGRGKWLCFASGTATKSFPGKCDTHKPFSPIKRRSVGKRGRK